MEASKIDGQRRLAISVRDEIRRVFDTRGGYSGLQKWIETYQGAYKQAARDFVHYIGEQNRDPSKRFFSFTDQSIDEILGVFILQELSKQKLFDR